MSAAPRQIGLPGATALVLGNMIGSGIFLLPASLAVYSGYSLLGWLISACGALLLAGVFYRLAKRAARPGGLYAYSRDAFGDCIGFLVAWVYWIGLFGGNAAIAVAFASYLSALVPAIGAQPLYGALTALAAIWLLTFVNIAGVRNASSVQILTTILKVLPLLAVVLFGFTKFDPRLLIPGPDAGSAPHAINTSVAMTLFAFTGLESATIPAQHVRNPESVIPRATLIGTVIAAIVYIACTAVVMGLIPGSTLASSNAPFAAAGRLLWGDWAGWLIAGAAAISCFGALNGWTLTTGQFPQAVARDGLLPASFARDSKRGTPVVALLVGAVIASILVLANYTHGMIAVFTFMVLLNTLSSVVGYLFCTMADVILSSRDDRAVALRNLIMACAAFAFLIWAVIGSGERAVYWTFVLLVLGIPIYVWQVRRHRTVGG